MKLAALVLLAAAGALLVGPAGLADASLVWDLRAPRVLAAIAAGAALGMSGVAMQTVLRNPLADPYILGMSGGASLGAVLAAVGAVAVPPALAGAIGAWIAAVLVGALSGGALSPRRNPPVPPPPPSGAENRGQGPGPVPPEGGPTVPPLSAPRRWWPWTGTPVSLRAPSWGDFFSGTLPHEDGARDRLLLVGVAVSMLAGALTTVVLQLAPEAAGVRAALYWLAGGLGGATMPAAAATLGAVVGLGALAHRWGRDLDALLLGEDTAATLGVSVATLRRAIVVSAAVLTGLVVALGGAIGFCGLLAPHLARRLYGATHHRLLPGAMGLGALLLLVADTAARTVAAPRELPVGALTALVGAPWMLVLLGRRAPC